jgi:hypothetical protein
VTTSLKNEKFILTGEKFTDAIAGCPTLNCHHGTKTEIIINNRVRIPAMSAT